MNRNFAASFLITLAAFAGHGACHADTTVCTVWQPVDFDGVDLTFVKSIRALAVWDDGLGGGPMLYAGGEFHCYLPGLPGAPINNLLRWNGKEWMSLSATLTAGTFGTGMFHSVDDLLPVPEGIPSALPGLYVIGSFDSTYPHFGGPDCDDIGRWTGETWTTVGTIPGVGKRLALYTPSGGTPELYAGGSFPAGGVLKWSPGVWTALPWTPNGGVDAMVVFDDGSGPVLVVTRNPCCEHPRLIMAWDGAIWTKLGECGPGEAHALTVWEDANGAALYAGGNFTTIGGVSANRIAKWDGRVWSALGSGLTNGTCEALTVFDDGYGEALYAGGSFTKAGGLPTKRIAKWNGKAWSPMALGVEGAPPGSSSAAVLTFQATDVGGDGAPALFVGGKFISASGLTAQSVARMETFESDQPEDLYCDGTVDGMDLAVLLAAWGVCPTSCPADLNGDDIVNGADLAILLGVWG